ncbi:MAG: hypothetical protein Q607_CBUC00110G0001, partial [Clostridium butyricum DORA_1]
LILFNFERLSLSKAKSNNDKYEEAKKL